MPDMTVPLPLSNVLAQHASPLSAPSSPIPIQRGKRGGEAGGGDASRKAEMAENLLPEAISPVGLIDGPAMSAHFSKPGAKMKWRLTLIRKNMPTIQVCQEYSHLIRSAACGVSWVEECHESERNA